MLAFDQDDVQFLAGLTKAKGIPPENIISNDLARQLSFLSSEINRQIGLLISRKGEVHSVIIGDNKTKDREMIFRAHGRAVESLAGRYITAEDVGIDVNDMEFIFQETENVVGVHQATTRLQSGQRVRVDGTAGRVVVMGAELRTLDIPRLIEKHHRAATRLAASG